MITALQSHMTSVSFIYQHVLMTLFCRLHHVHTR